MGPDTVYDLLVEIEQAAISCLDVPYCSMVWAGCSPPETCDNGLSIAVSGSILAQPTGCSVISYLEATIAVSICSGNPETYQESTQNAQIFYNTLSKIYGGLIAWYDNRADGCKDIVPNGFRCGREEDACDTYYSTWRIKL